MVPKEEFSAKYPDAWKINLQANGVNPFNNLHFAMQH
jgi:hypothetical protein